ncbi:MAG: adenosylmethionine--8-amino-7-oxononanoate transaminase [Hyphomicrobiaceae bacterium]|nr:adenosylmethionine--8-amino-7-oxononanoate transaminase [Hyphomicrobiaceae bacterium]
MSAEASPVWHPFTQAAVEPAPVAIARTEGACLVTADGRRILDAISSWWVVTHGHRHPAIEAAIIAAAGRLDQVIFAGFTHQPAEDLARALVGIAPAGLTRVFYSDSGSTAVEVAIKMALGTWHNRGHPGRSRILALEHAYHGDTIGTMSAGARGVFNAAYGPLLFEVGRLPLPGPGVREAAVAIERLESECRGGRVAALLVEPLVLGAGGMLAWPAATLADMAEVCRRHDVLLIADEVMTGFGRTGTLFAVEQAGIAPDILCLAKGLTGGALPLAATLASEEVYQAHLSRDRTKTFFHSSSYTANPIACAAGLANLGVWEAEPVLQRIAALAIRQQAAVGALAGKGPLRAPRAIGTIAAVDVAVPDAGYLASVGLAIRRAALARDVLVRPLGNTIYVMPPYCVTAEEIGSIYGAIEESVAEAMREHAA